jgi:hypothetical protein
MRRVVATVIDMSAEEVAPTPSTVPSESRRASCFLVTVLVLAIGGGVVGIVINLALAVGASKSWPQIALILTAVGIAGGLGALVARSVIATRELARRTTVGLEEAAIQVDVALEQVDRVAHPDAGVAGGSPDSSGPPVHAETAALHARLDQVGAQLDALRRSGNRTAWWTFVLGAVLGVLTQILFPG